MKPIFVKPLTNPMIIGKRLVKIGILTCLLLAPELVWHKLTIFMHMCYESLAFLLELALTHGLGIGKFHAQMTVFYSSWLVVLLLLYALWRKLPAMLNNVKTTLQNRAFLLKSRTIETWMRYSGLRKIKLLLQFAGISGSLMFLLT
ncbi:MAG: hypothetical protein PHH11_17255 [Methylomonas sp.]|nr:hypothetical protein [Methylomonas sp.]